MSPVKEKQSRKSLFRSGKQGEGSESDAQGTRRTAVHDFFQRTGSNLKKSVRRRSKPDEKASPVRDDSPRAPPQKLDIDDDVLDRLTGSGEEKVASESFLDRQRKKVSRQTPEGGLSEEDIIGMFIGAPYFETLEKEGKHGSKVVFRGGVQDTSETFPTDHRDFAVDAFRACTLGTRRCVKVEERTPIWNHRIDSRLAWSDLMEAPSMLSANAVELGTVGFQYFLQSQEAARIPDSDEISLEKREKLHSSPEELGLREFQGETLVARLSELGEIYTSGNASVWNEAKINEMGKELYSRILVDADDSSSTTSRLGSLQRQIRSLHNVLDSKGLWTDFSLVEWRIRAGQLLWNSEELEPDSAQVPLSMNERDILLLQIALAGELLVRVTALLSLSNTGTFAADQSREHPLEWLGVRRTPKTDWDLILASRFLENVTITTGSGQPLLAPKHGLRQLEGLESFAETLEWPHAADLRKCLEVKLTGENNPATNRLSRMSTAGSVYMTPLSSPRVPTTPGNRTSYFGGFTRQRTPGLTRTNTANSMHLLPAGSQGLSAGDADVGGWLSRSWLTGLVMPGEAAGHFLISALLENSAQAIIVLGAEANLEGGFVYEGRSFWSKSCIAGRVLAAAKGAKECMGWISAPESSDEVEDGWVGIQTKDVPLSFGAPRIMSDSAPVPEQKLGSVKSADLRTHSDGVPTIKNEVRFKGIEFSMLPTSDQQTITGATDLATNHDEADDNVKDTAEDATVATLVFSSPSSASQTTSIPLTHNVNFIASYPCHPVPPQPRPRARTAPSNQNPQPTPANKAKRASHTPASKDLPPAPAHPLHKDYAFRTLAASDLLPTPVVNPQIRVVPPSASGEIATPPTYQHHADDVDPATLAASARPENVLKDGETVTVIDCRGPSSNDLELLARAWCAQMGQHAVIGRVGRTCLGCCVREARGLGVRVVIRV